MKTTSKTTSINWITNATRSTVLLILAVLPFSNSMAQLNPMGAAYFQNQYMMNPAMAGQQQRLTFNAGVRQQFSSMPGAPLSQSLTADYGFSERAAVGLFVNNDRAGVLKRTHAAGSFAYHLPLSGAGQHLSFGISLSLANDRIDLSDVKGDTNDPDLYDMNQRETYMDGDFGMAYTSSGLQVQAALPNMKHLLKKDILEVANLPVFFSAISYRIPLGSMSTVEPKVVYRGVQGHDNLLDAGANLVFNSAAANKLNLFGMYHSAGSATFGMGVTWKNTFSFNGMYTTNTSALQGYTNGDFELNIGYSLFGR